MNCLEPLRNTWLTSIVISSSAGSLNMKFTARAPRTYTEIMSETLLYVLKIQIKTCDIVFRKERDFGTYGSHSPRICSDPNCATFPFLSVF